MELRLQPNKNIGVILTGKGDSTAEFILEIGKSLEAKEGVDVDLAKILNIYLLTTDPAQDAVALAKEAILKLAVERAGRSSAE